MVKLLVAVLVILLALPISTKAAGTFDLPATAAKQPTSPLVLSNLKSEELPVLKAGVSFDERNISQKAIAAVELRMDFFNAFDEIVATDTRTGTYEKRLVPGESRPGGMPWPEKAFNVTGLAHIVLTVTRVKFSDGSTWVAPRK